jgi:hypothetical protein
VVVDIERMVVQMIRELVDDDEQQEVYFGEQLEE